MAKKRKQDEEPKKKKKVGRPKKRGRKKVYYKRKKSKKSKQKQKGFSSNLTYNRVRKVIWENFREDFASYRAFISNQKDADGKPIKGTSIVSLVFEQCKSLDCLDNDIIEIYRQFRNQNPNDDAPVLPDSYYETHPYWELITEDWWAGFDERIWVVSPMLLYDPDYFLGVLGSDRLVDENDQLLNRRFDANRGDRLIEGKAKRFKEFVDYCNQLQTQGFIEGSDEVPHWRFTGKEDFDDDNVYWSEENQRWEIRIIICSKRGDLKDYEFSPSEPDRPINEDEINRILGRQIPAQPPAEEPVQEDIQQQIPFPPQTNEFRRQELENERIRLNIEQEKSRRKDKLLDQFISGRIDAKRFERLLKMI